MKMDTPCTAVPRLLPFRTATLVQRGIEPAAAFLQFGLEHVTVEDATVEHSQRTTLGIPRPGNIQVPPRSRMAPHPPGWVRKRRAEDGARTEEEVGCHDGGMVSKGQKGMCEDDLSTKIGGATALSKNNTGNPPSREHTSSSQVADGTSSTGMGWRNGIKRSERDVRG
jgi:hypothetical protein